METEHPENKPVFTAPSPIEADSAIIEARRARWASDFPPVKGFSQERMDEIYTTLDIAHYALGKSMDDIRHDLDEIAQGIPEMKRVRAAERDADAKHLTGDLKKEARQDAHMLRQSADKFAAMDATDDRMRRAVMLQYTQQIKAELPEIDQRVAAISPSLFGEYSKTFDKAASMYATIDGGRVDGLAKARSIFIGCAIEGEGDMGRAVALFKKSVFGDILEQGHKGSIEMDDAVAIAAGGGLSTNRKDKDNGKAELALQHLVIPVTAARPDYAGVAIAHVDDDVRATPIEENVKKVTVNVSGHVGAGYSDALSNKKTPEEIMIAKEMDGEAVTGNKYLADLPVIAGAHLNDLNYATYRTLIDNEHLFSWKITEKGIAITANSLNKLDAGNTVAKVMKKEFGYEHARGASMQIKNTLKEINLLMTDVQQGRLEVEPTMRVLDRAGTPTEDLTRRVREKKRRRLE
jgi:hypothetical protein